MNRTGGSIGQLLSVRRTNFEDRLLRAYRLRVLFRLGLGITDRRIAVVTRRVQDAPAYMKAGVLRYEEVHCLLPPERILERLRETKPDVLRGYPGTLGYLTPLMTDVDRPRLITTDSEMMTGEMRARIRDGFGAKVLDFYDSHEFNMIAAECASTGLYCVSDASIIAEVLHEGRHAEPGQQGELVAPRCTRRRCPSSASHLRSGDARPGALPLRRA